MDSRSFPIQIKDWLYQNAAVAVLVIIFVFIYFISQITGGAAVNFGNTGMEYLSGQYYRWVTCLFLHNNLWHLFSNSAAILAAGSLLSRILKKHLTVFAFLAGGILSELAYSAVSADSFYEVGASGGIFALIACLVVCCLRFSECFCMKWYRPDVIIVMIYFVLANSSITAFLVHMFGFVAGIILCFIMVLVGAIRRK